MSAVRLRGGLRTGVLLASLASLLWVVARGGHDLSPTAFAAMPTLLFFVLSAVAVGELVPAAIVAAAFGTLTLTLVSPLSLPASVGLALAVALAPRVMRAQTATGSVIAGALTVGAGTIAGWVIAHHVNADGLSIRMSALVVATLLASLGLFVRVDDPIANRFRGYALASAGAFRRRMVRALVLRRRTTNVMRSLSPQARRRFDRAWRTLVRAAEQRSGGARATRTVLDGRIDTYLRVLQRSLVAAHRARELSEDLDDAVLAELRLESEDLVATASALEEVRQQSVPANESNSEDRLSEQVTA